MVVFHTTAALDATLGSNGVADVYLRDLATSHAINIDRVNVPTSVAEANASSSQPAISSDGRYLSFQSTFKFTIDDTDTLSDIFRAHNSTHP